MKKKLIVVLVSILSVLILTVTVSAVSNTVQANLTYKNIKISLNGVIFEPKDVSGKTVEPFIIDGTTYLPVRAVAEAANMDVAWDSASSTVKLEYTPEMSDEDKIKLKTVMLIDQMSDELFLQEFQLMNYVNLGYTTNSITNNFWSRYTEKRDYINALGYLMPKEIQPLVELFETQLALYVPLHDDYKSYCATNNSKYLDAFMTEMLDCNDINLQVQNWIIAYYNDVVS